MSSDPRSPSEGVRPRRWPAALRWSLAIAAYLALFAAQIEVTRALFTTRFPGGNDFYPRWAGGCARLWDGSNPYAEATTLRIQQGIYGRPAHPGEDQVAYAYPLYTLALTWPTCLTHDFATVQAVWMTALMHLTLAGVGLTRAVTGWRPPPAVWALTLLWSVIVYPDARALLLGQLALVIFFLVAAALVSIGRGWDGLAGAALALATIKPQMVFLLIPWLLIWSVSHRRLGVVYGFLGTGTALILGATALQPTWIIDFARQLGAYVNYTELGSVTWIMTRYYLGTPPALDLALEATLALWLVVEWWRGRRLDFGASLWVTALTTALTPFIAPRTATTHFALLLLPMFMVFRLVERRSGGRGRWWILGVMAVTFLGLWLLFVATVRGNQESAINYLPVPLLVLAGVLIVRRGWASQVAV